MTLGSSGEPKFRQSVTASGARAGGRDVAVRLGQRELRAGVRVEQAKRPLPSVETATPRPVSSSTRTIAGVLGLGEHGVALHVAVVLRR